MKMGKKYSDSIKLLEKTKLYDANEAIALVCQTSKAKFDESTLPVGAAVYAYTAMRWLCEHSDI